HAGCTGRAVLSAEPLTTQGHMAFALRVSKRSDFLTRACRTPAIAGQHTRGPSERFRFSERSAVQCLRIDRPRIQILLRCVSPIPMSPMSLRPVLVVSDMHLSRIPSQSAAALAELLTQHPSHELVIAGDFFELALDPPGKDPSESIGEILSSQPELSRALARHLEAGAPLTLLAGNHDASVASAATHRQILKTLGVSRGAPLSTFPWFIRRAGVHIEHGHFYDPDNAPTHPLSLWNYQTEPLGVAMTRRFVAPNGAM